MVVAVIGMGLIGGSFAKAAERAGHVVHGIDKDTPLDAVSAADLVIVALPPAVVVPWVEANHSRFKDGAVVVDATGVKRIICEGLRKFAYETRWTFVGGHPMAGKEVSGFANSTPDLFQNASMILTPYPTCGRGPLDMLEKFFLSLGFGRIVYATPEHHDQMIALTSQLAHVVSSAYVQDCDALDYKGFSAGSFHDMTRVASLDPDIWTDLFIANSTELTAKLSALIERLTIFRDALAAADTKVMHDFLSHGRELRQTIIKL